MSANSRSRPLSMRALARRQITSHDLTGELGQISETPAGFNFRRAYHDYLQLQVWGVALAVCRSESPGSAPPVSDLGGCTGRSARRTQHDAAAALKTAFKPPRRAC